MKNLAIFVVFSSNFSEAEEEVILKQWLMISHNRYSSITETIMGIIYESYRYLSVSV